MVEGRVECDALQSVIGSAGVLLRERFAYARIRTQASRLASRDAMSPAKPLYLFAAIATFTFSGACGGKVIFEVGSGGTGTTGSGTGKGNSSSSSTGDCDPAAHTIDMAGFNFECLQASDCNPVFFGDFCGLCDCPNSAINVGDLPKYQAEVATKAQGTPPGGCFCPVSKAICVQGTCGVEGP
jgi:hypothetical protein